MGKRWGAAAAVESGRRREGARLGTERGNHAALGTSACYCWRGLGCVWACATCIRWSRVLGEAEARRAAFAEADR